MIATEPAPLRPTPATDVCHIAHTRDQALCGATLDASEPWCCDPPDEEGCGRPSCAACDRLWYGGQEAED